MRLVAISIFVLLSACGARGVSSTGGDLGTEGQAPGDMAGVVTGQVDSEFPTPAGAPAPPPKLKDVVATVEGDRVSVTFRPIPGAKDYRIYPMPAAADVTFDAGSIHVKNALYACGGDRFAPSTLLDQPSMHSGSASVNRTVESYARGDASATATTPPDATLGYVFTTPGMDRTPVYALTGSQINQDNACFDDGYIWGASRERRYTSSDTEHAALLTQGWRDDGIAFYAPTSGPTVDIQTAMTTGDYGSTMYFPAGSAEATARASLSPTTAFKALVAADPTHDTEPLMRVYYFSACGRGHDELVAGQGMYDRISLQGNQPVFEVQWSGLTAETTLVVEALDNGCPFQGIPGANTVDTPNATSGFGPNPQHFYSIADLRAADPHGEVYMNGSHDPTSQPNAVARSFVKVSPAPLPKMEWSDQLPGDDPGITFTPTMSPYIPAYPSSIYLTSDRYTAQYYNCENENTAMNQSYALGVVNGQLWSTLADAASDTTGKFRISPTKTATLATDTFLHATMTADLWSTGRRYPQIIISDQPSPVQDYIDQDFPTHATGNTLVLQTRGRWPFRVELQLCAASSQSVWDVNKQCPVFHFDGASGDTILPAHGWAAEESSTSQQLKRLEIYASTQRAYVFLAGKPYACADLPAAFKAGQASVTFGDVIYHSGADTDVTDGAMNYPLIENHLPHQTTRRFDNLGFDSGVSAPAWDETAYPCTSTQDPPL